MSALKQPVENGPVVPFWRTIPSNGRPERVGKFGIDMGDRGTYDERNKLNEMTGKEWVFFLNSIWIKAYPPVADECGFDLRKIHPCPKPPLLMRDVILFFTKRGQWILDPFAGVGGTLLGASLCQPARRAIGVDLNPAYVSAYGEAAKSEKLKAQLMLCGDSRKILDFPEISKREFDLIQIGRASCRERV